MAHLDDPPSDFLTYLESRLGKDEPAAAELLGEWLTTYEPRWRTAGPDFRPPLRDWSDAFAPVVTAKPD